LLSLDLVNQIHVMLLFTLLGKHTLDSNSWQGLF